MYVLLTVLIILVCVLIMAVVLIQNPKGGGLGAGFGGGAASNIMGVQKTGDVLEKATWYLAIALLVLSLSSAAFIDRGGEQDRIRSGEVTDQTYVPQNNTLPTVPEGQ